MNTTPFYELHDRLYDRASAGCASIAEDFRLKRAVDNMAPLAEANKTFARLRDMCAKLFTEPEPALLLADCIALADALAVVQGSFQDVPESHPSTLEYDVKYNKQAGWRSVKSLWASILTLSPHLEKLDPHEYDLLDDPRILEIFITASGEKNKYVQSFAEKMFDVYGASIVPLLKVALDMEDEKASGIQVDYVARLAGSAENEWYLSLAENESAPQNVRIKAIQALGLDSANGVRLLDFCRTEKGKVKTAALIETARLDPPGFDEILKKLISKYRDTYAPIIEASNSQTAVGFVREAIDKLCAETEKRPDQAQVNNTIKLLFRKDSVDECFLKLLDFSRKRDDARIIIDALNCVLIDDLMLEPRGNYEALVTRLHEKEPDAFFSAWCFMLFLNDPESAAAELKNRAPTSETSTIRLLLKFCISYSQAAGKYFLKLTDIFHAAGQRRIPLFTSIPQSLLELTSDTAALYSKNADAAAAERCSFFNDAIKRTSPADLDRLTAQAVKFAYAAMEVIPNPHALELISMYGAADNETLYRLVRNCAVKCFPDYQSIHAVADEPGLTAEQKRSILSELLHLAESKNKSYVGMIKMQLSRFS